MLYSARRETIYCALKEKLRNHSKYTNYIDECRRYRYIIGYRLQISRFEHIIPSSSQY